MNDSDNVAERLPGSDHITRREALSVLAGGALLSAQVACSDGAPRSSANAPVGGPLHFANVVDLAVRIESGELSPVELTRYMLDRIARIDPRLKSYATVTADHALAAAQAAEEEIGSGSYRGPLHGVPIAVKDLCFTRGIRTMGGTGALADFIPAYDATVITRLNDAGAILLGKLNLTEGAMAGYHPDFGLPVNPWDEALWAGASSSGSGVATAAGLCFASLGSDTGGSIRYPSMANGIVGLKPTYGRVSRHGVLALAETLDHVGPMTRSVGDAAVVFEAIAGHDPNDPTSLEEVVPDMLAEMHLGLGGVRVGYDAAYASDGVDADLVSSIEAALGEIEGLGAEIVPVEVPEFLPELLTAWVTICSYEARMAHAETYPSRADDYGPYFREFLEGGSAVTDRAYAEASALRDDYSNRLRSVLGSVDGIACPSGGVPFPIPAEVHYGGVADFAPYVTDHLRFQFTIPADFAGTPTISLPCGQNAFEIPHTIQFMGPALGEAMLCRIAFNYERATTWHTRHPIA